MRRLISLLMLNIFLNACATSVSSPTFTPILTSLKATDSPLPVSTKTTLTASEIVPRIESYCTDQREIELADLDLDKTTRLLVRPVQSQTDEVWTITSANLSPQFVSGTQSKTGSFYRFHGLSPNGKWLLLRESNYRSDIQEYLWILSVDGREKHNILSFKYEEYSLYVQSADGGQEWVISNVDYGPIFYWSAENQITVEAQASDSPSLDPSYPVFTINPFTLEGQTVFTSEETAGWSLGIRLGPNYSYNDVTYEIYKGMFDSGNKSGFFFYDRMNNSSLPAFQWLSNENWITWDYATLSGFRYWQDGSGLETMVIIQPYGIDLATGLDFTEITQVQDYTEVMEPIIIPPGNGHLAEYRSPNLMIGWISKDGSLFSLEHNSRDEINQFYIFDMRNMTLKDYCFLPRNQGSSIYSAPDGKLLAWNVNIWNEEHGYKGVKEIVLLEIATGKFVRIPDLELLGWGVVMP
jgi:hypothetical protein